MRIELKFTESKARFTFYYLKEKYNSKLAYTQKNFEKLAKLAVLTEAATQAKADLERIERLMPQIMADEEQETK